MRALIVDDDATFASAIQTELLGARDHVLVDAATSFAAAAALLDNIAYDVVVLDLDLGPGQNSGITILSNLRERFAAPPAVLVISAHVPTYLSEMLEFYPMVMATLHKPIDPPSVAMIVQKVATRRPA